LWKFRELYSCPLPVLIGVFKYMDINGYAVLSLANYRVNLLIDEEGREHVYSNIENNKWRELLLRVCLSIRRSSLNSLTSIERVFATSMFYGGFGLYLDIGGEISVLNLDYVNTRKLYFYLNPSEYALNTLRFDISDLVMIQYALRRGDYRLLHSICSRFTSRNCSFKTSHGLLVVANSPQEIPGHIRVIPDNNPFRHVIRY